MESGYYDPLPQRRCYDQRRGLVWRFSFSVSKPVTEIVEIKAL